MPKPNPPGDKVPVHIDLTAFLDDDGKVDFKAKSPLANGQKPEFIFNKRKQGMKKEDYHEIRFRLMKDETGMNLILPQDVKNAFWVVDCSNGAKRCPDHNDKSDYSEFNPVERKDDRTLFVENYNELERYWMFSVNFLKQLPDGSYDEADRANYVRYDPGGVNQDYSSRSLSSSSTIAASALVGAAVGAIVTVGFVSLT